MSEVHDDYKREHEVKRSTNRSFGFVMTVAFAVVALAPLVKGHPVRWWAAPIAAVFLLVTLVAPRVLAPLNLLWFKLGLLIGKVTSPIFLGVFFYFVLTPLALFLRVLGKDFLRLHRDGGAASYWIPRSPPGPEPASLRRQF
ncbi:MAG: hypothetical protein KIT84_27255 [Labilithrix sp.]|nr:hypothetical protein [Labilithrix sp.]MCW5814755.1 hypothetical protein [Labilithrix sp.]